MSTPEVLSATVRIAAPADVVFPYFTDATLLVQWIGDWADLLPEPDGVFALDVGGTAVRGRFLTVEPPTRVVLTWGVSGNDVIPPGSTTVEVVLTADGAETVVELFHRDLPAIELPAHRAGWAMFLDRLAASASG
jgi:uncharacterized protein YndB with AHSA1/START domain